MRYRKILRDNIQGIKKPAIQRIINRAGIGRINGIVYDYTRMILLHDILNPLIKNAIIYTDYAKRVTVTEEDVKNSIEHLTGKKIYDKFYVKPTCKTYSPKKSKVYDSKRRKGDTDNLMEQKIKFYRQQDDCFYFDNASFNRLINEVAQTYNMYIKFTKDARAGIQLITEQYLHQLFDKARDIIKIRRGHTIYPKDIEIALKFCGQNHIRNL